MRVRGAIMIAGGILIWLLLIWYGNEIRKLPWGYEFGSVAMPLPPWFIGLGWGGLVAFLIGIYLLLSDFMRRIKKRSA
jgi:hypothetical protein